MYVIFILFFFVLSDVEVRCYFWQSAICTYALISVEVKTRMLYRDISNGFSTEYKVDRTASIYLRDFARYESCRVQMGKAKKGRNEENKVSKWRT